MLEKKSGDDLGKIINLFSCQEAKLTQGNMEIAPLLTEYMIRRISLFFFWGGYS